MPPTSPTGAFPAQPGLRRPGTRPGARRRAVSEAALDFPWESELPDIGLKKELVPGLYWLRMPLPFVLDHINVWLLRDEVQGRSGWTLVDTGIANDHSRAVWESVFAQSLEGLPMVRVMATHMHPDHIGLADWLTARWRVDGAPCRLWMSHGDFVTARMLVSRPSGHGGDAAAAHYRAHGLSDPEAVRRVRERGNYYSAMVPAMPTTFRRLMHGDVVPIGGQDWRCIAGYGHAPEHMSLYNAAMGVLIAGDMVLPRISTNVSVTDGEPEADPLRLYLASLDSMMDLPPDTLVLPSHGRPFRGLHTRVQQLKTHHDERLDRVRGACQHSPHSAADLLPLLFSRSLDQHQLTFALGEAIAHLHLLWHKQQVVRQHGPDGVWRFSVL